MTSQNKRMGDTHEAWLIEMLGGRQSPGSGNQWRNPMDGRHNRYEQQFAWAWDGKSTRSKSVSVTRDMLNKAVEQSDGERPMIALRFYDDDRLRIHEDWFVIRASDFIELQEAAVTSIEYDADSNEERA